MSSNPTITFLPTASYCQGTSTTLEIQVNDPNATITWNGTQDGTSHTVQTPGLYEVVATNADGCVSNTGSITVTEVSAPVITLDATTSFCEDASVEIEAQVDDANATITWNGEAGTTTLVVNEGNTYTIVATNNDGCSSSASIVVTENPKPTVTGIDYTTTGGSASFSADGATHVTAYEWNFGDGSPTSDDNSPTHSYSEDNEYTITLTVSNDCGTESVTTTIIISTSGIAENDLGQISIFPVPATEIVNIEYQGAYEMETLVVMNSLGQIVFNGKINQGGNHQLNVENYATGLYHMNIILSNGDIIQRKFDVIK